MLGTLGINNLNIGLIILLTFGMSSKIHEVI